MTPDRDPAPDLPLGLASGLAPGLYSIPGGHSFVDHLARGLLDWLGASPLSLSSARVYLPTRRACRNLQEAFLRISEGRPLVLPRLLPLGEVEEEELMLRPGRDDGAPVLGDALPPALAPLSRQALLARLVLQWGQGLGDQPLEEGEAVLLAGALARLVDQVETMGLSFNSLSGLVPQEYAGHWQEVLRFLEIITQHWPAIIAERGSIGAAERRRRLAELQVEAWQAQPSADPVIVAGSSGSLPATASMMEAVLRLPQGVIVLPGLDRALPEAAWTSVGQDPVHPQHTLARLLARFGVAREAVRDWPTVPPEETVGATRLSFFSLALWPAAATGAWHQALAALENEPETRTIGGIQRLDCANDQEEALVIALLLREQLEHPGATAALVTANRDLARRVAVELRRWSIEIDDSAGTPLRDSPPGQFLRLLAQAAATGWAPVPLLALLKHPLSQAGQASAVFRRQVRTLERMVLRGPRPAEGLQGLRSALAQTDNEALIEWFDALADCLSDLEMERGERRSFPELLDKLIAAAEALARSDSELGSSRLWAGEAGEAAAHWVAALVEAAKSLESLRMAALPSVLDSFMSEAVVRPRWGRHSRLAILGPLEARLRQSDLMVLGSLNEGDWPRQVDPGPWLSRPMAVAFGLPEPEERIGLSAHDFVLACGARRVVLTRSERVEGAPSVPSRWLLRLEVLADALGIEAFAPKTDTRWQQWARQLDQPLERLEEKPPEPRPPVEARPRKLSVTRIETWLRDPYALYAERILALRKLDPLDADPSLADRGSLVHKALETFIESPPGSLPHDAAEQLIAEAEPLFEPLRARPAVHAFWWPRFCRVARWFVAEEKGRRDQLAQSFVELRGEAELEGPAGNFSLTATADRIDLTQTGDLTLIDYKTGSAPKETDVKSGLSPQLALEAALMARGAFAGLPAGLPVEMAFWVLSGGDPAGLVKPVKADSATLAEEAWEGLQRLVAAFDDPATAYPANPRPDLAPRYNDYLHLARQKAWSSSGGGE